MQNKNLKEIKDFNSEIIIESPGRINLIGEHIDYNGGFVLPAAIDKKIILFFKKNHKPIGKIKSLHFNKSIEINLKKKIKKRNTKWENYIIGVVYYIVKLKKNKLNGFDCIIDSDLAVSSGISSSSALVCGFIKGLNDLFNLRFSFLDIIKISKNVEHQFIGLKGGIMDQFTILKGKRDKLILLNCHSLKYEMINAKFSPYKFLLLNTNVPHELSSTKYNDRVKECQKAFKKISNKYIKFKCLAEVPEKIINNCESILEENEFNRALYVSQENHRVLKSINLIKNLDFKKFGELMYNSHEGLKNLYEVSCKELDYLVNDSKKYKEILGSRMMGGGFGGCTINFIREDFIENYIEIISEKYFKEFSRKLTPIVTSIEDGIKSKKLLIKRL